MSAPLAPRRVTVSWTGIDGNTYLFSLDAAIREYHRLPSDVTTHPVETGADIADNIRPLPDELEITGKISNTPIHIPGDHDEGAQFVNVEVKGAQPTIGNTFGRPIPIAGALLSRVPLPLPVDTGIVHGFSSEFDRIRAVWATLHQLRQDRLLVRVVTTLAEYTDMAVSNIGAPREPGTGNALTLELTFRKVRKGSATTAPVPLIPTARVSSGSAAAKAASEDQDTTVLFNLFGEK